MKLISTDIEVPRYAVTSGDSLSMGDFELSKWYYDEVAARKFAELKSSKEGKRYCVLKEVCVYFPKETEREIVCTELIPKKIIPGIGPGNHLEDGR